MKTPLPILVLALALLLVSCGSGLRSGDQSDDAGAIALSLEPGNRPIASFSLILAIGPLSHPTGPIVWVNWPRSDFLRVRKPDFGDVHGDNGYVYLFHLRPGTYSIGAFHLRGCNDLNSTAEPIFPLPVTIRPGRVVYIGSYVAYLLDPNISKKCDSRPARFKIVLSDRSRRDIEILKRLFPQERWDNISIELPYPAAANQPMVVTH